jgi:hypothetical protein
VGVIDDGAPVPGVNVSQCVRPWQHARISYVTQRYHATIARIAYFICGERVNNLMPARPGPLFAGPANTIHAAARGACSFALFHEIKVSFCFALLRLRRRSVRGVQDTLRMCTGDEDARTESAALVSRDPPVGACLTPLRRLKATCLAVYRGCREQRCYASLARVVVVSLRTLATID